MKVPAKKMVSNGTNTFKVEPKIFLFDFTMHLRYAYTVFHHKIKSCRSEIYRAKGSLLSNRDFLLALFYRPITVKTIK